MATLLPLGLACAFAAPTFAAQGGHIEPYGAPVFALTDNAFMGDEIANIGDINGDGYDDVLVSAPSAERVLHGLTGAVFAISGSDGQIIYHLQGANQWDALGSSVAGLSDLDLDGVPDFAVGIFGYDVPGLSGAGRIEVYSGATGSLMKAVNGTDHYSNLGRSITGLGDIDADGIPDWAYYNNLNSIPGIDMVSGATGQLIHRITDTPPDNYFGEDIADAGDIDADGIHDLLVSEFYTFNNGLVRSGSIYIYSGSTGLMIARQDGHLKNGSFGHFVSGAGDLNGDGFDDYMASETQYFSSLPATETKVFAFSGMDGSVLHVLKGEAPRDGFGYAIASIGDANGDGFPDILVGLPDATVPSGSHSGKVQLFSGLTGSYLNEYLGAEISGHLGAAVCGAGDQNGDGLADFVASDTLHSSGFPAPYNEGSLSFLSYDPFLRLSQHAISASQGGVITLEMNFSASSILADYATLLSLSGVGPALYGVEIPLTPDPLFRSSFMGTYPHASLHINLQGTLNQLGNATAQLVIPAGAATTIIGESLYIAVVAFPAGSFPTSTSSVQVVSFIP